MAEIDIFNIQPNKVSTSLKGKYLLLYGPAKIGKTTFCATQLPKSLLCAFEKGYTAIPGIKAVDIQKWTDFKKVVKQLESEEAHQLYDTLLVDTMSANICSI